jgi:hypothetical protein
MAYFNLNQYENAREAFIAAGKDERSAAYAKQWIGYMDSELARQKSLQDESAGNAAQQAAATPAGQGEEKPAENESAQEETKEQTEGQAASQPEVKAEG